MTVLNSSYIARVSNTSRIITQKDIGNDLGLHFASA